MSIQSYTQFKTFEKFTKGNLFQGLKACERGYQGVIGIKIIDKLNDKLIIEANPSILIKTKGQSIWGKYKYLPATSKLGNRTTKEHLIDLAINSIVLEKFQNAKVNYGLVLKENNNKIRFEKVFFKETLKNKALNIFTELNDSLKNSIPDITENRKKCSICSWQKYCDKEAKLKGYLTDIDGIGLKTAVSLKNIGVNNIKDLAKSNQYDLDQLLSNNSEKDIEKYAKLINQSKSYISGEAIQIKNSENHLKRIMRNNSGFFVFDIESNPDQNHDFLYGILSIKNIWHTSSEDIYKPILNLNNQNKSFYKILDELNSNKEWPILHYGETEKIAIVNLAKKANLIDSDIELLKSRFIDLHMMIRKSWILPLKNYSLKTVANWIGFNWELNNVSGSKALFWWLLYQNNQEDIFLQKIIRYNKDDCLATLHIAKWLIKKSKINLQEYRS